MGFENIIGNDKIKDILLKSLKNKTVLHSYMFIGNEGIGKKMLANKFAKMILCENYGFSINEKNSDKIETYKECKQCKSCIEFDGGNNPDFIKIEPEGRVIKIEQIREMQNKILEKPIISNKKVYIINDADLMTKEAQNCLLKTLEEPPEYIVIILIVSNESKMLTTIKSRCMKLQFQPIDDENIKNFLLQNNDLKGINKNMLKMCNGSIGKGIQLKDKFEDYENIENIIKNMDNNVIKVLNSSEILYKNKEDIYDYLEYINVILYEKAKDNINNNLKYINSIKIVEQVKQRLLSNCNYDMCIDKLLFNIWEEINEKYSRS